MTEMANSKRTQFQATYSPIELRDSPKLIRAWEKWTYFASLAAKIKDFTGMRERIQRRLAASVDDLQRQRFNKALTDLNILEALIPHLRTPDALSSVNVFKNISTETLVTLGETHLEMEEQHAEKLLKAHQQIVEAFTTTECDLSETTVATLPEDFELVTDSLPNAPDLAVYRRVRTQPPAKIDHVALKLAEPRLEAEEGGKSPRRETRRVTTANAGIEEVIAVRRTGAAPRTIFVEKTATAPLLSELARWAIQKELLSDEARELLDYSTRFETLRQPFSLKEMMMARLDGTKQLVDGFQRRMKVEPSGLLHLERINFTPAGMERGELVYAVPLSPDEEVNITHREWSNTNEEFEKLVTDSLENYSEQGVVEKSEIAESSSHQSQHSSGYNTGVTVSGGYGPVNVTSAFSYNVQDSASDSAQASKKRTQEITNKASSRVKQEHKVSFRVASAAGTEDQRVQKIKNPDPKNPTRVDYYQLIRKWRVDLERYGLRLTYDITIPEPGADILSRQLEIQELEKKLSEDFKFDLIPDKISRDNIQKYAAQYQASVEDPLQLKRTYSDHKEENWDDDIDKWHYAALEFDIDPNYHITQIVKNYNWASFDGGTIEWDVPEDRYIGLSGKVAIIYSYKNIRAYHVWLQITATLNEDVEKSWQLKAWNSLRDAAETNFEASRQRLRDRLDQLKAQIENFDALTLRKIEREEVMKGVIRWLFGPTFRFVPQGLPVNSSGLDLYGSDVQVASDDVWQKMLAFGEFIKFLHNAIEWENMLYFLYPYFWTHPNEWNTRRYIRHPDATHQQFLKAGCARVVLTIRPKFEGSFFSLMEIGDYSPDALVKFIKQNNLEHPYVSIATEMQNYAKTNYPGIPSANPAKHGGAWRQIQQFSTSLENFYEDCGRYPTTQEGLVALLGNPGNVPGWKGPYLSIKPIPKDPWGNDYQYKSPGDHGGFDIVSHGADGQPGGEDDNADIVSWAEGSLIGTWIEYTPTSALDIAIGEKMPLA